MKFRKRKSIVGVAKTLIKQYAENHVRFCATDCSDSYHELEDIKSKWDDLCETSIKNAIKETDEYFQIYAKELITYANENNLDDSDFCVCDTVLKLSEVKIK